MLTIHKYQFDVSGAFEIRIPQGAKILKFDNQNEIPTIWALVDNEVEKERVRFLLFGTGYGVPTLTHLEYIGSAQFANGQLVWHLFMTNVTEKEV